MYEIKASKTGWVPEGESEKETLEITRFTEYDLEDELDFWLWSIGDVASKAKKRTVEIIVRVWDEEDRILAD